MISLALAAGACSSSDSTVETTADAPITTLPPIVETTTTAAPTTTTTSTTTTTLLEGPTSLLNGLPVLDGAALERRVVAVKVDNHPAARPQSGIQDAGAVIELLVEAGITRFIALFHTSDSDYVGPIRSGRPTDPTLVRPLGASFQISGAQPWVQMMIRDAGVEFLGESSPNTFRIPRGNRAYERTLYGSTTAIREVADSRGHNDDPPPGPWFAFGEPAPTAADATDITLSWSSDWPAVRWEWDGTQYLRFNRDIPHEWVDREGEGEQIAVDTLVVLTAARYTASPPAGAGGSSVPALDTVGSGTAIVFYDGGVVEGTWERGSIAEFFVLTGADGAAMVLPPGRLWVNIFPSDRSVTWE